MQKYYTRRAKDPHRLTYENMLSPAFFKRIMPSLNFDDPNRFTAKHSSPPHIWKEVLDTRGVVRLHPDEVWGSSGFPTELSKRIAEAIDRLHKFNLPAWLIVCSEEAKYLFKTMTQIVQAGVKKDGYEDISDYAIISVTKSGKGWVPHRDRDSLKNAFDADGFPNYITAWMPITDATVDNSCLYFIPKNYDATFHLADDSNIKEALKDAEMYQNIIAMPVNAGGMISFASRTIHWGSRLMKPIEGFSEKIVPRKAISLAIARKKFEEPALARQRGNEVPTFLESVVLAASNAIRYKHQHSLTKSENECFTRVVNEHKELLNSKYLEMIGM